MKIPDVKAAVDEEWNKLEKMPAWQVMKVKSKKQVIEKAQKEGRTVHFATQMDFCLSRTRCWSKRAKHIKGRVVLRGDVVEDDSRINAAFTEQGSSASQMTAAKALDVSASTWRCAGQASDAVSAHTQVQMENAPTLLNFPKFEFVEIWIRLPVGQHTQKCSHSSLLCTVVAFSLLRCVHLQLTIITVVLGSSRIENCAPLSSCHPCTSAHTLPAG